MDSRNYADIGLRAVNNVLESDYTHHKTGETVSYIDVRCEDQRATVITMLLSLGCYKYTHRYHYRISGHSENYAAAQYDFFLRVFLTDVGRLITNTQEV